MIRLPRSPLRGQLIQRLGAFSIRRKLLLLVGVFLGLGAINIAVYYLGAKQRAAEFSRLRRAIERQTIIVDVMDQLEDEKRFVDLLGSGVLGSAEGVTPAVEDQRQFTEKLDLITIQLATMAELSEPDSRDTVFALRDKTEELTRWWKAFYANQGVDATAAIVASATAEPIANDLLASRMPIAVQHEKEQLALASEAFVRTDETTSRIAWLIFLVSALAGSALAFVTLTDLFRSIELLKAGADEIGQGRLEHRISVPGGDELGAVALSFNQMADRLGKHTKKIEEQKQISEDLLLNILPAQIAAELSEHGRVEPKYYADTTILFADLVQFNQLFENLSVDRMVQLLDQLFTDFDHVVRAYRLEKLKTIGDAYMCAGGLAQEGSSHPIDIVMAGFDIIEAVKTRATKENLPLSVRVGIHTGPVAAGVVGIDKFAFDLWGETVNFAARLEATGKPNRVNISSGTFLRVKDFFDCEHRGPIETKEKRGYEMYFVNGLHPELVGEGCPPTPFARRYEIYFEQAPSQFPQSLVTA